MIMPTPKPSEFWIYAVRQYNYETGKHEILSYFEEKEKAHFEVRRLKVLHKDEPLNFEYEKIEKGRPDLHHERLKEERGYKK